MEILDTETATVDLNAGATVLTHTITTATPLADLLLDVGDGTDDLAAAAPTTLTVAITVDGVPVFGEDQTTLVAAGRTRLRFPFMYQFPVNAGEVVVVTLSSDQAADTSVAVTATLSDAAATPIATVSRTQAIEASRTTSSIVRKQASQWTVTVDGLSALPAGNAIYFTVKAALGDTDAESLIQVRLPIDGVTGNNGLSILNGADVYASRSAEANITYSPYVESEVTYYRIVATVEGDATVDIAASGSSSPYVWDIKSVGTDDTELDSGSMRVTAGITLAV